MIGVVTGFMAEARCLRHGRNRFVCSAGDSERARKGAERLVCQGVEALVSFGLAGGLDPSAVPGMLLLPEAVILPSGRHIKTAPGWRRRLVELARTIDLAPLIEPVAGSDHLLASPPAKQALYRATHALAVDMESHAVAEIAEAAKLPYMVVRAIADPHDRSIPEAARQGIGPEGRIKLLALLRELLRHPEDIGSTFRLGRESNRGLSALRRLASLDPDLAFI